MAGKTDLAPDPTAIGEISSPPFVRLPDPDDLFSRRAARLRLLGSVSPLKPYLEFLADLSGVQAAVQKELGPVSPSDTSRKPEMPCIDRDVAASDGTLNSTFDNLFDRVHHIVKPQDAADALARVAAASPAERRSMIDAVFTGMLPPDAIAEHIYIWAGLQLHFTRLASALDPKAVLPVADGVCPTCGSMPSGSIVVGWKGAHGARFCSCSVCNTLWHYVRIKCVCCGSTKGVGYKEV